ncbi:hypothetical protein F441_16669 [Phytophthora nicotianae CJ01A1]|uniref:Uncharacterized protein n=2 Tax=Phytophthora nicotianae TaxID=4792 RepID=W2IBH0_PHYNI|nr:hypothetical protein L915_16368 [Phytophthora nicotianae]ETL30822.1 hypothetical protein L916_16262 [Phytophthora nicotianae]ETP07015.1 hypothetical protein F441_16669 [Phytophthora nicotianae CJ01A1]
MKAPAMPRRQCVIPTVVSVKLTDSFVDRLNSGDHYYEHDAVEDSKEKRGVPMSEGRNLAATRVAHRYCSRRHLVFGNTIACHALRLAVHQENNHGLIQDRLSCSGFARWSY